MKRYSYYETQRIAEDLGRKIQFMSENIKELETQQLNLQFFDLKGKKKIDEDIACCRTLRSYLTTARLMILLYLDSIVSGSGLSDEQIIEIEECAANSDGLSKIQLFCQRCFIDRNITKKDIKKLQIEANGGSSISDCILQSYKAFFED